MSVRRGATLPEDGGATPSSRLNQVLRLGEQNRAAALPLSPNGAVVGASAANAANAADGAVADAPRRLSTLTFPTTQVEKVLQDKIRELEAQVQERNTALSKALVELTDVSKRARACAAQSAELRAKREEEAIEQAEFEEEYDRLREQVEWLQERCDYVYEPPEPPSLDTEPYGGAAPDPERAAAEERVRKGRARSELRALRRRRMEERDPLMDGIDYPPLIGASACKGASAPIVGRRSSSRLDEVLRAGSKARTDADAEGSLMRTLKRTSLVPTGACLPRNFDPDYCAYDGYYAIGVGLVSTTLGVLVNTDLPSLLYGHVAGALQQTLGKMCHTRKDGWIFYGPEYEDMDRDEQRSAIDDFPAVCQALAGSLTAHEVMTLTTFWNKEKQLGGALGILAFKLVHLIAGPAFITAFQAGDSLGRPGESQAFVAGMVAGSIQHLYVLKYIARYMSEHALMIASFFRVNAKRLRASEPLLTDLKAFAQQCKEDIADGPNPPPPPPTPGELTAAMAAAEARKQGMEERDPLMDGIDYPPSIGASACK